MNEQGVQAGVKFGLGFFIGVFVIAPLLLIGGCALLLTASNDDESSSPVRAALVSASLLEELSSRARSAVADESGARPIGATCRDRGFQREDFVPDYHLIACVVTARDGGATVRFRQRVECFAERPTLDACHADDPVLA